MAEIKVQPTVPPEDPQYVQDMLDKVDGQEAVVTDNQDIPSLLAGKYKDEEALQKGIIELLKKQNEGKTLEDVYKNLESGLGTKKDPTPPATQTTEPTPKSEGPGEEPSFDLTPFETELLEKGELSEESYTELEKQGFPKQVVDVYLAGQKAVAEKLQTEFYTLVGGQDNYTAMLDWAASNLSPSEIQAYNNAVNTDIDMGKLAAEALYARYIKAKGSPPKTLVQGTASSTPGGQYASRAQLIADINDPRYSKDPAFRKAVQEKLARSNVF